MLPHGFCLALSLPFCLELCPLCGAILFQKGIHVNAHGIVLALAGFSQLAIVNPALRGKIGTLRTVEAMVEAGVVAAGKGHHKLSRAMDHLQTGDSVPGGGAMKGEA